LSERSREGNLVDQRVERFSKDLFSQEQVQQIADDHVKFGGAESSTVSTAGAFWIVTTVLSPIAADDDAPAAAAKPATAGSTGAATGATAAGPTAAAVGAAVAAGATPGGSNAVNLDASVIPKNRKPVASQILEAFAAAGFEIHQQVAALANAIAESSLDPTASEETTIEASFGLFQLNTKGGLGVGHSKEELIKPDVNISIVIKAARNAKTFPHTATLATAVAAFVREVERPANQDGEITKRLKIANELFS
jgi:hypothetical protein